MNDYFKTVISKKTEKMLMQVTFIIFFILFTYIMFLTCSPITKQSNHCSNIDIITRLFVFKKHESENLLGTPFVTVFLISLWIAMYFKQKELEKKLSTEVERNRLIKAFKQCLLNYLYALLLWILLFTTIVLLELTVPPITHILLILYMLSEAGVYILAYRDITVRG